MNIVYIDLFAKSGGAARIKREIMDYMKRKGHTVHQFVVHAEGVQAEDTIELPALSETEQGAWQQQFAAAQLPDTFSPQLLAMLQHPVYKAADIVHLHCTNGNYFSYLLLPYLAQKRLIWTFHDTLAVTAGCLQPHLCDHWQTGYCADCPQDQGQPSGRSRLQHLKESIVGLADFEIVVPSDWLEMIAAQSIFQQKTIHRICNGIDTDVFRPENKRTARRKLGLPENRFILMFAAHGGILNDMKGGRYLIDVLKRLQQVYPEVVFLHVGGPGEGRPKDVTLEVINYPYIDDQKQMARLYAAADVFVSTSLSESFGLTVCEAMACGTPVVAFAAGGIVDVLGKDNRAGCLIPLGNTERMAKALMEAVEHPKEMAEAGKSAAKRARRLFSNKNMCEKYEKLYGK